MAEMSDAEVFGAAPSAKPQKVMSDAEVFGTSAPLASQAPLSDDAVGISKPGIWDYLGETGKAFVRGGVETAAVAPLHGIGAQNLGPDQTLEAAIGRLQRGEGLDTAVEGAISENRSPLPVTQNPAYQLGTSISEATSGALPDRNILNPVVRDVAGGFGSVAGNIATSLIPGVRTLAVPSLLSQGAGEAAERAVKAGATEDQIRRAAGFGNISGATEFADLLLLNLGSTGKALGLLSRVGLRTAQGAFIEGGQEGLQQFIQNVISKGVYNPKQDLTEDVAYNAMIGAIVGGGMANVVPEKSPLASGETPPTPETVAAAAAPIGSAPTPLEAAPLAGGVQPDAAVIEPPPAPTVEEVKATTMAPAIVNHLAMNAPAPEPLAVPEQQLDFENLVAPMKEEVQSAPGANTARLAKLLGPKLYGNPSEIAPVTVKELFQNSFDALKGVLEKGQLQEGNIDITMEPQTRTISVLDDGSGMTSEVLAKQFLEIAGTSKETKRASGGLGIAKMLFIFGNKKLNVTTMRDGKVSQLITTGEELFSALDDKTKAPKIQVRPATAEDRRLFPKGHGTRVQVTVPEQFADTSTGEMRGIDFKPYKYQHNVLQRSPLLDSINVRFNGETIDIGTRFPLNNFTQFRNLNADWGTARIYVTKAPDESMEYQKNVHVLSNGLWQFSLDIKKDPSGSYGPNVKHEFYIDVNSKVAPEDQGYPFDLNRQQFAPSSRKAFDNLFKYMGLIYQQAGMSEEIQNFGSMQFLDYDVEKKGVKASTTVKLQPKTKIAPIGPSIGDDVKIIDGKLVVNNREVPELTPVEIEKFRINNDDFRVDQSEIDPKRIILHDNVDIEVSSVETRAITDYGRERFGRRFDEYAFAIGDAFRRLRDVVVELMPPPIKFKPSGDPLQQIPFGVSVEGGKVKNGYEELAKEGIGISLDREYRGVSIKLPFSAMFLNPFLPRRVDNPVHSAVDMVLTMVHELAHFKERNHGDDGAFQGEFQKILGLLETEPSFNFHSFKQNVVNIVSAYNDVLTHMNGVFTGGDFNIRARGKRFEDSGTDKVGDAGGLSDTSGLGSESEKGSKLSDWVATGSTVSPTESRRGEPFAETSRSGSHRPSDNGRGANYAALRAVDSGITAPPQQPEVNVIRQGVNNVLNTTGGPPPTAPTGSPSPGNPIAQAAAHADRINWFYKFFAGLTELLDANPLFAPLRKYTERVRAMHSDETRIHDEALRVMKSWRHLKQQSKNLEAFILDIQAMPYLTPGERSLAAWRHPTPQEFDALRIKHKLSDEALKVYNQIRKMDEGFLRLVEQNAIAEAQRTIQDPVKLTARVDEIAVYGRLARMQPFFPFTRFGRYYIEVKDAAGKIIRFETFEPKRVAGVTVKRAEKYQQARLREVEKKLQPGETARAGVLPETAEPLIGMPTLLLQAMQGGGAALGFTPDQINAITQLQNMRNPGMALNQRSRFLSDDQKVPGYSLDLPRSFARYYFHGGRYYAKVRHSWALRGHIAEAQLAPGNKAGLIASYMSDHLQHTVLDARGDFGFFKGAIFLWAMGYVPAAATQNLTQTPMITLPYLAAKFGDVRAAGALVKAMADVSSFYRRGAYDNASAPEMRALEYGIKTGRISETQAPELAGIASGGNLFNGQGGSKPQRAVVFVQEKAAYMFEMAEQFNRRIAYRAAFNLALRDPKRKFVEESVQKYQDEYQAILATQGYNESEARATVAAIHAVDRTQYVYARVARPRFMRGPLLSTLFVFKRYMQSTLYMLGHNKSDVLPRFLVIAMLMGGLGGVPGYEDMAGVFRALAKWMFGKDVNVDRLVREYVLQWSDGTVEPDLVLHGLARRGFGLPALADMMGSFYTGNNGRGLSSKPAVNVPYPMLDRSKALSMGNILPVDLGKALSPGDKVDKTIADQTQKASGAVFSVGFNMYKALFDSHMQASDLKRWERAVPRALGSVSRSYRAFSEGRERGKGGPNSAPTIVNYDVNDTEQMLEAFALAGGYQPLRQQAKWDQIIAKAEVTAFYDFKRKALLEQYFEATKSRNRLDIEKVREELIKFNKELPEFARAKAISGDTVQRSMKGRERTLQSRESGIPTQKSNAGISRYIDSLFPEATIDVRRR